MEKGICIIEMWEDFKREIKRQFYLEDVAYLARKNMRHLKHTGSICVSRSSLRSCLRFLT